MRELSLHILDISQNSLASGATFVDIIVDEDPEKDLMTIIIEDNGRGMPEELLSRVLDPFVTTRTSRKVGLGLPLFREAARQCEGDLVIHSAEGKGTRVVATFRLSHWDRAPLGDMVSTIVALVACNPGVDFRYVHRRGDREYEFDTRIFRKHLGDISLGNPLVACLIKREIEEGEKGLDW